MNKVLLVVPPITHEEMHGALAEAGSAEPCLGLCYLASNLKKYSIDVEILDSIALGLSLQQVVSEIERIKPMVVGITAVTITINRAAALARLIKKINKNIIVVVGGPHISALPERTMSEFPDIDIGVVAEAEDSFTEMILRLKNNSSLDQVKGLVLRDKERIYSTGPRELIQDLDRLPLPAWELLPKLSKYYHTPAYSLNRSPSSSIISTRGCGFNCSFCFQQALGKKVRSHGVEYTFKMIRELYYNYGIRDIRIVDDNFMLFKNRLLKVCETLQNEKLNLTWSCLARADMVEFEILKKMKQAGCCQISFGIESGCQEILDSVNKKISLEKIRRAVELTKKAGIKTLGYFMLGFPNETEELITQTIEFAKQLELDDFKMQFLTPYPGCLLYEKAHNYGTFDLFDWDRMNAETAPCFIPFGLTQDKLIYFKKRAFREFYLRPRIVYSYLKILPKSGNFIKLYRAAKAFLKYLITNSNHKVKNKSQKKQKRAHFSKQK